MDRMVIMRKWFDNIKSLCNEQQMKDICYAVIMYGLYDEAAGGSDDPLTQMSLNFILPQINNMQNTYQEKVEYGKTHGRKKQVDDQRVYELASAGKTGVEIGKELGLSKSAVYASDGWRRFKELGQNF